MNQLRDIQLPPAVSWWPIASGWWFILAISLLLLFFVIQFLRQRWRYYLPSKVAMTRVKKLEKLVNNPKHARRILIELSTLIRRVSLAYYPRCQVARLTGVAWLSFLNQTTAKPYFSHCGDLLIDYAYRPVVNADVKPAITAVKAWLVALPKSQGRRLRV